MLTNLCCFVLVSLNWDMFSQSIALFWSCVTIGLHKTSYLLSVTCLFPSFLSTFHFLNFVKKIGNWFNFCDLFCVMFSTISTYFVGRQYLLVDTSPFEYSYGVGHSDTPTLMFILYEFAITLIYIFFGEGGCIKHHMYYDLCI